MTLTISHEKTREITREEVDRAIDVIERHLEKEARTRNLLDEQAIMRPKDLCKQQGLDMVAELRGMMYPPSRRTCRARRSQRGRGPTKGDAQ